MPHIRTLVPVVSREQALEQFSRRMPGASLLKMIYGPVHTVSDFYIPFQFFRVSSGDSESLLGIDTVTGKLDLYEFEDLPEADDVQYIESRNCPEVLLDEPRARELLIRQVKRRNFARQLRGGVPITAEPVAGEIYIPYWVGFRGRGSRSRFYVMDAMREQIEQGKVRQLLRAWLTSIAAGRG